MSRPKLHIQQNDLFCKNLCGYFGNPQWGGFCSKCYRELIQSGAGATVANRSQLPFGNNVPAKIPGKIGAGQPNAATPPSSGAAASEEKKKKSNKISFFKKNKPKPGGGEEVVSDGDAGRLSLSCTAPDSGGDPSASPSDAMSASIPAPASDLPGPDTHASSSSRRATSTDDCGGDLPPVHRLSTPAVDRLPSLAAYPFLSAPSRSTASCASDPPTPYPDPSSGPDPDPRPSAASPDLAAIRDMVITCLQPPYCLYLKYAKLSEVPPASPRPSHLSLESIQIHKVLTETLSSLTKAAADDVRKQIQTHMESCANAAETASLEEMTELVQNFYNAFHDRVHSHQAYYGVAPERRAELEDLAERYLTTRLYRVLFTPLSQQLEDADLAIQKQIRSLYWVSAHLLQLNIDQSNPEVTELVESAITDIIEVDSKRTPQDKLACISSCVAHLLEMLCVGRQGEPPSADDLLPALIFVVLRANPPRLQSNVQYVTRFSSQQRIMSGQQGYDFTNLCCAVSFIESMGADSLGLTSDEYTRYMSGEVLPEDWESGRYQCQALHLMDSNAETLTSLQERQNRLLSGEAALGNDMDRLYENVSSSVEGTLSATPLTLRPPKRPAHIDSPAGNEDVLPTPLVPTQVDGAAQMQGALAQLPEPPPGLLSGAQDSLTELLSMSNLSLEPSSPSPMPLRPPAELPPPPAELPPPPAELPPPPAELLPPPAELPLPPPPAELTGPLEPAPRLPPRAPAAAHRPAPLPLPEDGLSLLPPRPPALVRAGRGAVDSIPSIACSTGGAAPPPPPQEGAASRRRMSELPRSISTEGQLSRRRLSELPRSVSQTGVGGPVLPPRGSVTRAELMAQQARKFSESRSELARSRLQVEPELTFQAASPTDSDEERLWLARQLDRRASVRDPEPDPEPDQPTSVRDRREERRVSESAAATATLEAKCQAARQRKTSEKPDKSDKFVKVLSGIFSLTDNF